MNNSKKCITILLIFLTVVWPKLSFSIGNVETLCLEKKNFLLESKKKGIPIEKVITSVATPAVDVILIGVEHNNFEMELYPQIVNQIKFQSPDFNCFFIEESLGEEAKQIISNFNNRISGSDESLKLLFNSAYPFFQFLRNLGIKIHFIDYPQKDSLPLSTPEEINHWLNTRDQYMANHISYLKQSNQCKKALFPVGLSHVVKAKDRVDLKSHFLEFGIKSSEILLLISGRNSSTSSPDYESSLINPSLIWLTSSTRSLTPSPSSLICKENPSVSIESYGFINNKDSKIPISYSADTKEFIGTFGEFQATILYSCQSEKCKHDNVTIESWFKNKNLPVY